MIRCSVTSWRTDLHQNPPFDRGHPGASATAVEEGRLIPTDDTYGLFSTTGPVEHVEGGVAPLRSCFSQSE